MSETTRPMFSILVPTFNQAKYLVPCLDSIVAQTDADWEALVVNDGSTDDTRRLADAYAKRDPRIRVVHKANGGVASALNEGLALARGDWVQWLSSDDMFDPERLSVYRNAIEAHPDRRFFYSYFRLLKEQTGELIDHGLWGPLPEPDVQIPSLLYRNYVSGITVCVEREAWRSIGLFDESLRYGQDYDMWLRLLSRFPGVFIPKWTAISRNHAEQGSQTFLKACHYDTAKSGIRHLSRAPLRELFPMLDLARADNAQRAVDAMLDVAAADDAFVYAMGWHPTLLLRVVEFVEATRSGDSRLARRLSALARWRCRRAIRRIGAGPAAFPWKVAYAALCIPGIELKAIGSDPIDVGIARYFQTLAAHDPEAFPLREYFERFHGRKLPIARQGLAAPGDVVIELTGLTGRDPDPLQGKLAEFHEALVRRGWRPVWFHEGDVRIAMVKGSPVFSGPRAALKRIRRLFDFHLALSADTRRSCAEPGTLSLSLAHLDDIDDGVEGLLNLLSWRRGREKRIGEPDLLGRLSVIFVVHSTRGGGAERATTNLAAQLAARGWIVRIVMTRDETIPPAPRGVEIVSLPVHAREVAEKKLAETTVTPPVPAGPSAPLDRSQRAWRRLTPETRAFILHIPGMRRVANGARSVWLLARRLRMRAVSPPEPPPPPKFDPDPVMSRMHRALQSHETMALQLADIIAQSGRDAHVISVLEGSAVETWLSSLLTETPFICWLHTVESLYFPQIHPDPTRFGAEFALFATATRSADSVVAPTQACAADIERFFALPSGQVRSIWNPVDLGETRRLAESGRRSPSAVPTFVSVGRLSEEKNHALLLDAFARLLKSHPEARCRIVGDGKLRDAIGRRIAELGIGANVEIVGHLDNPFAEIAGATALVLTSKFESFALVLVEAMALGVAAIAVDCPTGPSEVLGDVGVLTPPDDAHALAAAMARLIDDPRFARKVAEPGPARAALFDSALAAGRWEALFEKRRERPQNGSIDP